MPMPKSSYTGQAVFEANISQVMERKVKKRAPDNKPDLKTVMNRYSESLAQGDEEMSSFWLDIYCEMTSDEL